MSGGDMKASLRFDAIHVSAQPCLREFFGIRVRRIEHRLAAIASGPARLDARLTKADAGHHAALRLDLSGALIESAADDPDAIQALTGAFEELERRMDRHLSRERREQLWARELRRQGITLPPAAAARRQKAVFV